MAPPRGPKRRERIFDHATIETGAKILENVRRRAELRARLEKTAQIDPAIVADVQRWIRREGLTREDILLELGQQKLPDLLTVLESRRRAQANSGGPAAAPSDIETFVRNRLGHKKVKPRVAVSAPMTIARVVEAIKKRHPEIRNWLEELGLSVEDGAQLMYKVLDYSKARGKTASAREAAFQRRIDRRGGVLWEMLLTLDRDVVRAERAAALENAKDWIMSDPKRFGVKNNAAAELVAQVESRFAAAASTEPRFGRGILQSETNPGIGAVDPVAVNLWMMRFTEIRDEAGRLIMDHQRGLVSFSPDGIDVTPCGIGESKFGSKAAELLAQSVRNTGRASDTFRAANLPDPSVLPVRIRWGKSVVMIAQTEAAGPVRAPADYAASVSKAAGRKLKVQFVRAGTLEGAKKSRDVVREFMRLLEMENLGED